jgi:molecular chaperone GrpE
MSPTEDQSPGPVIRDRRRIDPVTGQVRDSAEPGPQQRKPSGAGGQPRPGRHSVSKPGGATSGAGPAEAGPAAGAGSASAGSASAGSASAGSASASSGPDGGGAGPVTDQAAVMLAERTADLQRLQAEYANYRKRVERDRLAVREQALANVLSELLPVLDDIGRAREHGELTGGFKSVGEALESVAVKLGLTSYGENGDPFDPTLHEALMHEYSDEVTETTCVRILQPGYKVGDRIIRPARVAVAEPSDDVGLPPDPDSPEPASPADAGEAGAGDAATGEAAPRRDDGAGV